MQDCSFLVDIYHSAATFCTLADDDAKITDWIQSIGTIFALAIAIGAPLLQNWHNRKEDDRKQEAEIKSFLRAIRAEVMGAWENYNLMVRNGVQLVKPGEYVSSTFQFSERSFSIYDSSGVQVGKILDAELQRLIVNTYGLAKSLIASTQINNEMLRKLEASENSQSSSLIAPRADIRKKLIDYAYTLKAIDAALEMSVNNLIERLDRNLTQSS